MPVCSHEQQPGILFFGRIEGSDVEMDETQDMAASTLLALLRSKRESIVVFGEELSNVGVLTACGNASVPDELGRLPVADNVGCTSLEDLHVVLQL